jgi:hypothetical protein
MDTLSAFKRGQFTKDNEPMVFDWELAAMMIKEKKPHIASAGLRDDWTYTGGCIYKHGKPVKKEDTYTYLASKWAVPEIELDGIRYPCYKMKSKTPGWDADTYWPAEALKILVEKVREEE